MQNYHRVMAEINLDAIGHNIREIKKCIEPKTKLLAVVKADGYGHGALEVSKVSLYNGADWLGVATCDEGVELRNAGIQVPILILSRTVASQLEIVINNSLTQTVYTYEMAKELSDMAKNLGREAFAHIKIDTGMSRIGFLPNEESLDIIEEIFKLENLNVTGIFTHFSTADEEDKSFTKKQFERFLYMTNSIEKRGHKLIRHCANSAAIIDMPELQLDMVRSGIITYGMFPSDFVSKSVDLKPAMSIKSQIIHIKELDENIGIGYGRTYYTNKITKVGTVPIGYADGYSRLLSNKARVIVNGKYASVIGNVCMDQLMIDLTDIECKIGDTVILMGESNGLSVSAEELAKIEGTINYEIVCDVGKRVPRVYIRNNEVINTIKGV
ncbi:MAG: alanine racemase [Lachnospirales bacterium]